MFYVSLFLPGSEPSVMCLSVRSVCGQQELAGVGESDKCYA